MKYDMIQIEEYLINKNNIAYIYNRISNNDGFRYKKTYTINIVSNGGVTVQLNTYDKEEFDKWWDMLK